jgi:transcriptional regulator with XRE-family HTH domain
VTTLAEFLRARREQLQPADVGLVDTGRRRTPGLRREEVATLAGVSIDYLVRLEQGRDTHPSGAVVAALADALLLDEDQRRQLQTLAMIGHSQELCPGPRPLVRSVAPTVHTLLDRLGPTPAFVVGPAGDVLAWNPAWARIAAGLGLLDDEQPNLARHVFLHPDAGAVYPDRDVVADEQVSRLREASTHWSGDDSVVALIEELGSSPDFASRWRTFSRAEKRRGSLRLRHPALGPLVVDYEVLLLADDADEHRLVTWLPADEATTAAFAGVEDAPTSPAQLRVIG